MLVNYDKVSIYQGENCILHDVDFRVNEGEFVYIIGRVGSGKSSLLKTIYGEFKITDGTGIVLGYHIKGIKRKSLQELRRQMGIVFQDFQLLNDRTVQENLRFVLRSTGWKKKDIQPRIDEVLKQVGMVNKGYKMPSELSGGEQQRIVIARAILNRPQLILCDEPTGNLDIETSKQILTLLKSICDNGSTVIMSTHNLALINNFQGRVYRCMDNQLTEITEDFNSPLDMDEFSLLHMAESVQPLKNDKDNDDNP
ncbi:MAG: ATP-binding cassette domain-containing protein [Bacteroidaceae bacterium]|nr:ATP-binding cassette domain-containing protein [Bacteroidaceae bacterium]